jgi:hypothetical protein
MAGRALGDNWGKIEVLDYTSRGHDITHKHRV